MGEYSILEQIKLRLKQFHVETIEKEDGISSDVVVFDEKEDNPLIEQLIKQATQEIVAKRCYPTNYTQEQIENDIKKYESNIVNLAVYDHSQAGESFMASFSENGVSRNWKDRDILFDGIFPFVKAL